MPPCQHQYHNVFNVRQWLVPCTAPPLALSTHQPGALWYAGSRHPRAARGAQAPREAAIVTVGLRVANFNFEAIQWIDVVERSL
jgi:hypothetical protein